MGKFVEFPDEFKAAKLRRLRGLDNHEALHYQLTPSPFYTISGYSTTIRGNLRWPEEKKNVERRLNRGWWLLPSIILGAFMWVWIIRAIVSIF